MCSTVSSLSVIINLTLDWTCYFVSCVFISGVYSLPFADLSADEYEDYS